MIAPSRSATGRVRGSSRRRRAIDNAGIAELLALEAEQASGHVQMALKRASRAAFLWPEEAIALVEDGRPLTTLSGVGPFIAELLQRWIDAPPRIKPAAIRAGFLTLARARTVLAAKPRWTSLLQGDLQMHTLWSDGSATVAEMAQAGMDRGYRYIAITDHTKGLKIANGLDEARLEAQAREIAKVNGNLAKRGTEFTVLQSAEVNLSPLGEPDLDQGTMARLDLVLASFHSALRRSEDQTARYVAALRQPGVHILGHPQTRVYNHRLGLQADWRRVFAEAARLDKAVEIDGYADRQDLRLELVKLAVAEGARISLGTDAHHPEQLAFMELSLASACLAKVPPERILNFMSLMDLRQWATGLRSRAGKTS